MNALLLVAHGSRRAESNKEVAALADRLRQTAQKEYSLVAHAFLELAEPSIGDAIDTLAKAGVAEVVVSPYFLSAGRHVVEDVPNIIGEANRRHPDMSFVVLPHIGAVSRMPELILESART